MAKVLVIDEEEDIVKVLEMHLRLLGHDVVSTTDGLAAPELARKHRPDLITLDFELPGTDGGKVWRLLKASPKTRSIPVLFVTGKRVSLIRAEYPEVPEAEFLTKPLDFRRFDERVTALLAPAPVRRRELRVPASK